MPADRPPPPRKDSDRESSRRDALVGWILIAIAVAGGVLVWTMPVTSPQRSPASDRIVDRVVTIAGKEGEAIRIRIAKPVVLDVVVDGPEGVRATFGPEQPVETEPKDTPEPSASTRWTTRKGTTSRSIAAFAPGLYVLRFDSEAGPAPTSLHVHVTQRNWREGPVGEPPPDGPSR